MFDTALGLPVHPLVIHAVVVLGPLAALTAVAYAVRPGWRALLRWPLAALAVLTGVTAVVAHASGEQLQRRVLADPALTDEQVRLVQEHASAGDLTRLACVVFAVVALAAVLWALRPGAGTPPPLAGAAAVVLVAAAGFALVAIIRAGHTGSSSVWSQLVG